MFGVIIVVIVLGSVMLFDDSIALKGTTKPTAVSCSFCVN